MKIRELVDASTRAYLRQRGIDVGSRPSGADPRLTYQSDLIEDHIGNLQLDPALRDDLADILVDALPAGLADLVATAVHTIPDYWRTPRWRDAVEYIVRSHLEREAGI